MLRLGFEKRHRALRAIGDQAADFVVLEQKRHGTKDGGDDQYGYAESPGQQAVNGLFLNGDGPRLAVACHYSLPCQPHRKSALTSFYGTVPVFFPVRSRSVWKPGL
jgi:hypothetical protein